MTFASCNSYPEEQFSFSKSVGAAPSILFKQSARKKYCFWREFWRAGSTWICSRTQNVDMCSGAQQNTYLRSVLRTNAYSARNSLMAAPPEQEETAQAPVQPRKKFRVQPRMGNPSSTADMGVMGVFQYLKSEARQLKEAGVARCLEDGEEYMTPLLAHYLNGSASRSYMDENGEDYVAHNSQHFSSMQEKDGLKVDSLTGTVAAEFNAELCFNLHIDLVEKLKATDVVEEDGSYGLYLDYAGGSSKPKAKKSGGFQLPYETVNVRALRFSKLNQDRCIFGFTATEYKKVLGNRGTALLDAVKIRVGGLFKNRSVVLSQAHVLFHWNDHSFFTYHRDDKGKVAVVVNLSPCATTDFHVAGATDRAVMKKCGQAHIVPTNVYHRSGSAPRRCIKIVFFLEIMEPVDVDEEKVDAADIKQEVKPEVDSHVQHETAQEGRTTE